MADIEGTADFRELVRRFRDVCFVLAVLFLPGSVNAQSPSPYEPASPYEHASERLKRGCEDAVAGRGTMASNFCVGTVWAITDLNQIEPAMKGVFCKPNGVTYLDLVRAVNANAHQYPNTLSPAAIAYKSLQAAYPCR